MVSEKDFVATEALYLNKEGKVVKHNDPSKIEKLADVGHRIPYERAKELGLIKDEVKAEAPEESKATEDEEIQLEAKEDEPKAKPVHKAPAKSGKK